MRHSRAADRRDPASGVKDLTIASNNAGIDNEGLGKLLRTRQVKKMISSYVGENKEFERQYLAGELEVEFCPQGTLAERMRAGGAGIPGFYTKTGVGTQVAEGKEVKEFDGEDYILERGIRADLSIIKGWKADESGNLMFRKTARNFNQPAATCGKVCVAEVEEIVPVGSLDPDCIHLPSIYVKRLILGAPYDKKIEFRDRARKGGGVMAPVDQRLGPQPDGGAGREGAAATAITSISASASRRWSPTISRQGMTVTLQSENGMLGIGPFPYDDEVDADLINAGKQTISELPQLSYFGSSDSFAMIRGGHIDLDRARRDGGQREAATSPTG